MVFIMDFFGDHELLQKTLFDGVSNNDAAKALGTHMGLAHSKTHSSIADAKTVGRLTKAYANAELRGIQLEFVFSKCYREHEYAAKLRDDSDFMGEIEKMKSIYKGDV